MAASRTIDAEEDGPATGVVAGCGGSGQGNVRVGRVRAGRASSNAEPGGGRAAMPRSGTALLTATKGRPEQYRQPVLDVQEGLVAAMPSAAHDVVWDSGHYMRRTAAASSRRDQGRRRTGSFQLFVIWYDR